MVLLIAGMDIDFRYGGYKTRLCTTERNAKFVVRIMT